MRMHGGALAVVAAVVLAALSGGCTSKDATYCDAQTPCTDPGHPRCNLELLRCEAAPPDGGRDGAVGDGAVGDGAGGDGAVSDGGAADGAAADGGGDDGGVSCPPLQRACGGGCYDLDDPTHCGVSCTACPTPAHATATCDGIACDFTCASGYWQDGAACAVCDTAAHCGATCVACMAPANGQPTCDGTACGFTCDQAFWKNGTTCDACDTVAHCGPSCATCSGMTPECQGGQSGHCGCTSTSCDGVTPVCVASTGQCRACAQHTECVSGVCGDDGACVAAADIIYLQPTGCNDGGAGTSATPFCTFPTALAAAKAGPRRHIIARAGYYHVSTVQEIENQRVVVAGVAMNQVTIGQDAANVPVFSVRRGGSLWLSRLSVVGATGAAGDGLLCAPTGPVGGTPNVTLDEGTVSNHEGHGVNATTCDVTLRRSWVSGNDSLGIRGSAAHVTLLASRVTRNLAGGLHLASGTYDIANSLIARNGTPDPFGSALGGARFESVSGSRRFVNNTVVDNQAQAGAASAGVWCEGAYSYDLVNSILFLNAPGQQLGCSVSYSAVQDGGTANGNIADYPLFVDRPNSDYHLSLLPTPSPCIDAGTLSGAPTVDLDDYLRSGNPDMGCFEAH